MKKRNVLLFVLGIILVPPLLLISLPFLGGFLIQLFIIFPLSVLSSDLSTLVAEKFDIALQYILLHQIRFTVVIEILWILAMNPWREQKKPKLKTKSVSKLREILSESSL